MSAPTVKAQQSRPAAAVTSMARSRWSRSVKILCFLLFVLLPPGSQAFAYDYLVYVGTYTGKGSQGIYAYGFDATTGESSPLGLVASTDNPSYLAVDPTGRFLFAANELDTFHNEPTGAVGVFEIDRASGKLRLLQQVSSLGGGPAHLSVDRSGRYLLVANYGGGNVAVFPIGNDGRLGPHSAFVQDVGSSVNPERQAGPHAHFIQVTNDNRFAMVADLGLDKVLVYRFDANTGLLTPGSSPFVTVNAGAGPRHLAFAPSGKFVYVVNELASTVTVFAYQPIPGTLHATQTLSTLPKNFSGKNTAAEIVVDRRGRFLYVSNRGHDSLVVFHINPNDGRLTPVEWVASGGKTPRHFSIDPSGQWLFAANQDSDDIKLFRVNPRSGRLTPRSGSLGLGSPVCVIFVSSRTLRSP
jgi:6-phosphogluconolactonase